MYFLIDKIQKGRETIRPLLFFFFFQVDEIYLNVKEKERKKEEKLFQERLKILHILVMQ